MKKLLMVVVVLMFTSGIVFASGGKERGDKAQGTAGSSGGGTVTQTRGK